MIKVSSVGRVLLLYVSLFWEEDLEKVAQLGSEDACSKSTALSYASVSSSTKVGTIKFH